jgi:thiamine-phosphate diphosphorylase
VIDVARLHVVTDDEVLTRADFLDVAEAVLDSGGEALALHVRGPATDGRTLHEFVHALVVLRRSQARVFVNDRVDVALAAGADGAHLGGRSLSVREARALVGPAISIGISVHDSAGVAAARRDGAEYAFVGTLFATPTHAGRAGQGGALVSEVAKGADGLPVVGIGGITPGRVSDVIRAGGHGVAVIRGVWNAGDPARAVGEYLSALERANSGGAEIAE